MGNQYDKNSIFATTPYQRGGNRRKEIDEFIEQCRERDSLEELQSHHSIIGWGQWLIWRLSR